MTRAAARVLLFTGKGGVGKTTAAAATALACADAGMRTLVLSTDPAHSLADAFDVALGTEPAEITGSLWGQQLDAQDRMEDSWAQIQQYLLTVFNWAGLEGVEAEELSVIPGLDELFALSDIKACADCGAWDVLVVDCAPTAETIRLLSLPDILRWYMQRLFPAGRQITKVVAPVLTRVSNLPVAGDEVFEATSRFYERLDGVREVLTDAERTTVRLVVNPERIVIAEARRTFTYLSLFGYGVDAVVANRLLPDAIQDPWFDRWKQLHANHLAEIVEGFAPVPVLPAELADDELVGLARLRGFATELYRDVDPAAILHTGAPLRVDAAEGALVLTVELPFAEREEVDLGRRRDELLVRVGPYRRNILLPESLRSRKVTGASLRGGELRVAFGEHLPSYAEAAAPAAVR